MTHVIVEVKPVAGSGLIRTYNVLKSEKKQAKGDEKRDSVFKA